MTTKTTLYYAYDPMCGWCYAFRPVWQQIQKQLPSNINVQYVLGGLAPDSDVPMPIETQEYIQGHWNRIIEKVPGTILNFDFWKNNTPKRSTYPACRAIILAREQNLEIEMLEAIQDAYYRNAQNPSEYNILKDIAVSIGINGEKFLEELNCKKTQAELINDINLAQSIGGDSFPSLLLHRKNPITRINYGYTDANIALSEISALLTK